MPGILIFEYAANVTSVIAFLFAGYQFFQWRKQQRHSLELETILEMEDRYEILMASLMRMQGAFIQVQKDEKKFSERSREEQARFKKWLNGEFSEKIRILGQSITDNANNYSLVCFRAKRLGFEIDKTKEINCEWIQDEFESFVKKELSIEESGHAISEMKIKAQKAFEDLRKL